MAITNENRIRQTWGDSFGSFASRCLQVLIVIALATVVVIAGITLKTEVIAVLLALILACAFSPLKRLLVRVKVPQSLAALVTLLLVLGVLAGVLTGVGFAIAGQASDLAASASKGVTQVLAFLKDAGVPIDGAQVQGFVDDAKTFLTSSQFGSSAISGLSTVGEIATGTVLLIFVLFFFLRDGARIWSFLIRPFKGEHHARAQRIGDSAAVVLGSYARGTATVALFDAIFIGVGLAILQVPLALPLAVFVFITAFIPIIGAPLAGALAAAVALVSNGPVSALIVIAIVIVANQIEGNLLHPLIMARAVSLHPLVVLLALTAGTILGGVVGAILAVPTASVVWAAIKAWRHPQAAVGAPAVAPEPVVPPAVGKRRGRQAKRRG